MRLASCCSHVNARHARRLGMRTLPRQAQQRLTALGIEKRHFQACKMPFQPEQSVVDAGLDIYDRPVQMSPGTLTAWQRLSSAAKGEDVTIQLVSAFRSFAYQCRIIERKRERGQSMDEILRVSAIPGFSEHHSGCALDLTTPGHPPLEESFEQSDAFGWLSRQAHEFGFTLSYPRNNPLNVDYEPWHWCWHR